MATAAALEVIDPRTNRPRIWGWRSSTNQTRPVRPAVVDSLSDPTADGSARLTTTSAALGAFRPLVVGVLRHHHDAATRTQRRNSWQFPLGQSLQKSSPESA